MTCFPGLSQREYLPELMDDPNSNREQLYNTLAQFARINALFARYKSLIKKFIFAPIIKAKSKNTLYIVDLGAGGGDIAQWMSEFALKLKLNIRILCVDKDPRVVDYLKKQLSHQSNIDIIEGDVFSNSNISPLRKWDYLFANHFLHHLPWEQIPLAIENIYRKTKSNFVLSDLKRSYFSYYGYSLYAKLFTRDSFAFYDGRVSIRRGFHRKELKEILKNHLPALKNNFEIKEIFPGRIYLTKTNFNNKPVKIP